MKRLLLTIGTMTSAIGVVAGFNGGLPDETHAWGMNDVSCPQPVKVDNDFGGVPSDAVVFGSADKISKTLAADCQLHFCCRSLDSFSYFGTPLKFAATPCADGWIAVDAVLHVGGEGHSGYALVFVNGILVGDFPVKPVAGAKPLSVAGKNVCLLWARATPPPWAEKLCGAYADRALIAEKRRALAEEQVLLLGSLRACRKGERVWGLARRRVEVAVTAYATCREEKFERLFRAECEKYAALAAEDAEGKTYANPNSLLTISRLLFPLLKDGAIDEDFPLWKVIKDKGVKPWG